MKFNMVKITFYQNILVYLKVQLKFLSKTFFLEGVKTFRINCPNVDNIVDPSEIKLSDVIIVMIAKFIKQVKIVLLILIITIYNY